MSRPSACALVGHHGLVNTHVHVRSNGCGVLTSSSLRPLLEGCCRRAEPSTYATLSTGTLTALARPVLAVVCCAAANGHLQGQQWNSLSPPQVVLSIYDSILTPGMAAAHRHRMLYQKEIHYGLLCC